MKYSKCYNCGIIFGYKIDWICSCIFSEKEKALSKQWRLTYPKFFRIKTEKEILKEILK